MKAILAILACVLCTTMAENWGAQSKEGAADLQCGGENGLSGLILTEQTSQSSSSSNSQNSSSSQSNGGSSNSESSASQSQVNYSKLTMRLYCSDTEGTNSQNATSSSSSSKSSSQSEKREECSFSKGWKVDEESKSCSGDSYIVGVAGAAADGGKDFKCSLKCGKKQKLKRQSECHEVTSVLRPGNPNQLLNAPTKIKGCFPELAVGWGLEGTTLTVKICKF